MPEHGGFVAISGSPEEHATAVLEAVHDPEFMLAERTRFLEAFVRPRGIERSATDAFVDLLEDARVAGSGARGGPALLLRPLLAAATLRGTIRRMRGSHA
jgi:hypothetical protein